MAINLSDNLQVNFPKHIDARLYDNQTPYSSSAQVTGSIISPYRYKGLTVFISSSTEVAEYWFRDGIADTDLILKTSPSSGSFSGIYSSSFSGSGLTTIDDVGGINANTSIDNLEGKNFSALFDEIFFPTVAPTAQPAGSATTAISITAGSGGSGTTREVGDTVDVDLTTTYNSGSWRAGTLNSTKRSYYGPATNYYFTSGSTTEDASTTDNYTFNNHIVTYLTNTFSTAVSYSAGEIPVNSKNIEVPLSTNSAGFLTPSNSTFTGIYPWFYGSSSTNITSTDVVNAIEGFYNGSPVGGSAKSITTSTGTITALYPDTSTDYYFWIAIPTQSTSKTKWFQNLNNNGNIGGPSNLFNTEIIENNVSASGYWVNDYKIYISNYATRFSTGEDIGQVQLLNL